MIYFNKVFSNLNSYLKSWQEILGGELEDNCLRTKEGVVYSYTFSTHRIFIVQLHFDDEVIIKRSSFDPYISYNFLSSDNLRFTPGRRNVIMALPSDSTSTSVFLSNKNSLIRFPANYDLNLVVMHVPFTTFQRFLSKDHEFFKLLHYGKITYFHESFNVGMRKMMNIFKDTYPPALQEEFLKHHSWELFLNFFNEFFYQHDSQNNGVNKELKVKLQGVRDFMLSDLACPKTIKELESFSGMSATRLRATFKTMYGMSIYSMFQERRMDQAWKLLHKNDMTVSEVAYRLGYSNLSHFTEVFKRRYGCCPKDCKKY